MNSRPALQDDSDIQIAIVSALSPLGTGGLSAYGRNLVEQITRSTGLPAAFMGYHDEASDAGREWDTVPPLRTKTMQHSKSWRALWRPLLSRLAPRPWVHRLLELTASLAIPPGRLAKQFASLKAVHFVGTGWDFVGFPFMAAARRLGARFTVWPAVHAHAWGDDAIDLRLYRMADSVFCQSDFEAEHLCARGLPREKVVRCGLPPMCRPDGDGARLRQRFEIGTRPAVLFLGRRDEGKGFFALQQAWPKVVQHVPEAVLLLAGPNGAGGNGAASGQSSRSVIDLGVPDEEQKADALAACNVLCLPSAHESFGIAYVEAWSYGKPVICGSAAASRELVEPGVTGAWSNQDPATLANDIIRCLSSPEQASRWGEAGRECQRLRYNPGAMLDTHLHAWGVG